MSKKLLVLLCVMFMTSIAFSQLIPNVISFKSDPGLADSLRTADYPYIFPFWGESVQKKGVHLPYSAGLGANYIWQKSDILIDNLQVGFNGGPKVPLDEAVKFNEAVSTLHGANIRPNLWLLPFLNVYAILGQGKTSTAIEAAISLPDTNNNWNEVTTLSTKAEFDVTTFGFGLTPTMGIGGGWLALDFNFAWTDVPALSEPAFSFVFGPRAGKVFKFEGTEMELGFWVGGFRLEISSGTDGSLLLADLLNIEGLQNKVDQGLIKVEDAQLQLDTWWDGLTLTEKKNPGNIKRYDAGNRVIGGVGELLTNLDGALSNAETATVQYSMDKTQKNKWNFVVGTQFQINRHWMFRAEYGFLGHRQQFIGGLEYRFGI